jgi:hypothetical protein
MSVEHEITKRAADGTLTIPELRQFLDEFDKATPPGTSPYPGGEALKLKARVAFGGGIKSIRVTIPGGDEQR